VSSISLSLTQQFVNVVALSLSLTREYKRVYVVTLSLSLYTVCTAHSVICA
jgi:hypothetical protein